MGEAEERRRAGMLCDLGALVQAVSGEQVLGEPVNQFSGAGVARYLFAQERPLQDTMQEPAASVQETRNAGVSVSILLRMRADELKARIAALESRL